MKALSLKQPWLHAITDLGKRVENRTWKPPSYNFEERIALHASKSWDEKGEAAIEKIAGKPLNGDFVRGAIIATAVVTGWIAYADDGTPCVRYRKHEPYFRDPWFFGPWGWILDDVHKLARPIHCRGMLGLWTVPQDILRQIQFQQEIQAT